MASNMWKYISRRWLSRLDWERAVEATPELLPFLYQRYGPDMVLDQAPVVGCTQRFYPRQIFLEFKTPNRGMARTGRR